MDEARFTAAIDRIEKAFCERYNVRELPTHLAYAVVSARSGDLATLESDLADRELYRWRPVVLEAIKEAKKAQADAPDEEDEEPVIEGSDEEQGAAVEVVPVEEDGTATTDAPENLVDIADLDYRDIQAIAKDKGLSASGTKEELIERIRKA